MENNYNISVRIKNGTTAAALLLYPLIAGFAFAVHPNIGSLVLDQPIIEKIAEFPYMST
jgi:hypothetical protein